MPYFSEPNYLEKLAHHFKQPLARLSAIFIKLSILSSLDDKVQSSHISPLCEEGERLLGQLSSFLTDYQLLKLTPPLLQEISWCDVVDDLSQMGKITIVENLPLERFSTHILLFPHVLQALVAHHVRRVGTTQEILLMARQVDQQLHFFITRHEDLWDDLTARRVLYPLADPHIPAPHWDLAAVSMLVETHLNGHLVPLYDETRCGFHLMITLSSSEAIR